MSETSLHGAFEFADRAVAPAASHVLASRESRIAFRYAEASPWLVLHRQVDVELLIEPPSCRLPNVPPWMSGIVNVRGQLMPTFDVAAWISRAPEPTAGRRLLQIGKGSQAAAVWCAGEPRVLSWAPAAGAVHAVPASLADFCDGSADSDVGPSLSFLAFDWFAAAGGIAPSRFQQGSDS